MQTKLYTTQSSHHSTIKSQPVPEPRSQNSEITNITKFPKKFELLDKRGFEQTEMRKKESCSPANPHGVEYFP